MSGMVNTATMLWPCAQSSLYTYGEGSNTGLAGVNISFTSARLLHILRKDLHACDLKAVP